MKLVVHDLALGRPLLNAQPERIPHVYAYRLQPFPLPADQLATKEIIQRLLLALPAKPQRLARFQIAYHRQELALLAPVDFVHSHLSQREPPPLRFPSFQIPQIHGSYRALRQSRPSCHLTCRRALARLPHDFLEALAERRLGRQLLHLLHPDAAFRTSQAVYFHNHRRAEYAPWQVPDLPLPHILDRMQSPPASATFKPSVEWLASHPQFQCLGLFVHLVPIHPITGPSQNRRPFFVCQLLSVAKTLTALKALMVRYVSRIPAESRKNQERSRHAPGRTYDWGQFHRRRVRVPGFVSFTSPGGLP